MKKNPFSLQSLDILTGNEKKCYPSDILVNHHHRCYRNKATVNYYLYGEEGLEYINFKKGNSIVQHWLRGACKYGIMPANGLIYVPPHACMCRSDIKLNSFFALSSEFSLNEERKTNFNERLTKGKDINESIFSSKLATTDDWPVYRHDYKRSNFISSELSCDLTHSWTTKLGGALTQPIIADNKVFISAPNNNQIHCINSKKGGIRWAFTTKGGVDTPPSYYKGYIVFGTRCGFVYCLNADDASLIWCFQAAPNDMRLMAFNYLESPWPVNGSVIVKDDKVYCVAGRSMHLNEGLFMYILDFKTGKLIQEKQLKAETEIKGELDQTMLPDILVGDENYLYMRKWKFSLKDLAGINKATYIDTGKYINREQIYGNCKHLYSYGGNFLDDSLINHSVKAYRNTKSKLLVFDKNTIFGMQVHKTIGRYYSCPDDVFIAGKNKNKLFAKDIDNKKYNWQMEIGVIGQSMVATDNNIILAGVSDIIDKNDPLGAFENRKNGVLVIYSKNNGIKLSEYTLPSSPVFDGMSVANCSIFIALKNGKLICYGNK